MKHYDYETLGEVWVKSMFEVLEKGTFINDGDLNLLEVCNLSFTIASINHNDEIINKFADTDRIKLMEEKYSTCGLVGDYKIDYGSYIYNNNGVNQVEWIINRINKKPETKSATITLHKAGEEYLSCLSLLDFKVRNAKLNMTVVYRSQNVFSSQPGNLLALHKIHSEIGRQLNLKIGNVELIIISAHIYEKDFESARTIVDVFKEKFL